MAMLETLKCGPRVQSTSVTPAARNHISQVGSASALTGMSIWRRGWGGTRRRCLQQLRTVERMHVLRLQKNGPQAGIAAAPIADADIDVVALEVRQSRI